MQEERGLKVFEAHGVEFTGRRGDQVYGVCPFSGKRDKFYVNVKTYCWDSKVAGKSGNLSQFLDEVAKLYVGQLTPVLLERLADDRHLPSVAFRWWEIGWDGRQYTLPIRDHKGYVQDVRRYQLGHRMMSTPGCHVGLIGSQRIKQLSTDPIYLCEGEWDAIAMYWLLQKVNRSGITVGVPGASVLKQEWVELFNGRTVHTLYDGDEAGENGELLALRRLQGVASHLTFVHWPDGVHVGFDTRDYIVYGAVKQKTPLKCFEALHRKFRPHPRKTVLDPSVAKSLKQTTEPTRKSNWEHTTPEFDDVVERFQKWLYLPNTIGIETMLATVVSQQVEGPPVWMFLVSPPGGAKTETLTSLSDISSVYLTSSLTPRALISGANWQGDKDPSLIPKLDGKVMVIKDFTSILSMRDSDKDEIFGILRDAYDGRCRKVFGTGVIRSYESRFTILAGVTPQIYALTSHHISLGERFLKCMIGDSLEHFSEQDIIRRAITNVEQDTEMKWDLADVVQAFIQKHEFNRKIPRGSLPALSKDLLNRLIFLGMFTARLRGTVTRDQFRTDQVLARPSAEIGTRLGVQLAKFARSLALVHGHHEVRDDDFRLTKKVALDTVNQRVEDLVRILHQRCPTIDDTLSTIELSHLSRYPIATVSRILQDLDILDVARRTGTSYRFHWTLSPYIREAIARSGLYQSDEDFNRPRVTPFLIRRKKKKEKR